MADNTQPTSGYVNYNLCRSFNQHITTALTMLTGASTPGFVLSAAPSSTVRSHGAFLTGGMPCSEVIVINKTAGDLTLFDNDYSDALNGLLISTGESVVLRGLTNVAQVSAVAASAGSIYFRTQFFSSNPSR
tara:strand:+ start:149 stop:544 length:396 start_codon:yes stop_codon:yes gene_type:complete